MMTVVKCHKIAAKVLHFHANNVENKSKTIRPIGIPHHVSALFQFWLET